MGISDSIIPGLVIGFFLRMRRISAHNRTAAFGGHPHQSRIGSEEPILDSFSLKGEAFGGNLPPCTAKRAALDTGQGFSPRGEAVSHWLFGTNG